MWKKKGNKIMLTELSAAAQEVGLEDCGVWIRANHRENDYDSEEQVEVSCDENGFMIIDLLEDWMVEEN